MLIEDINLAKSVHGRYDNKMSQTAIPNKSSKIVYIPLYEGVQLLDLSGPAEVLSQANCTVDYLAYDIRYVCSAPQGMVTSSAGLRLAGEPLPSDVSHVHTLLVPGAKAPALQAALKDKTLIRWLSKVANYADRKVSVCSGAFFLGSIGLLTGRNVTTHWAATKQLQNQYPKTKVEQDTLFVHDDDLWTSAGVLSGVDMALAIVSHDLGTEVALRIAREIVVFLVRSGGQSQFSAPIDLQAKAGRSDLLRLIAWLETQLDKAITVEQMAEFMTTSVRTLHRRCQTTFSMTPAQIVSELRVERGRALLHQIKLPIKSIANSCGFSHSASFSKAFSRRFGVAPADYRQSFQCRE